MEKHQLLTLGQQALKQAYAPYSKFHVGSVIVCDNGKIYSGVNVENASYGLTLCAEASAIAQMIGDGGKTICEILVTSNHESVCVPCGACRQRIKEFANKSTTVYLCDHKKIVQTLTIDELLPCAFSLSQATGNDYV